MFKCGSPCLLDLAHEFFRTVDRTFDNRGPRRFANIEPIQHGVVFDGVSVDHDSSVSADFDRPTASMKKRNPPELFRPPQRPKYGGTATGACTLTYQVKGWSGSMRYVLSLMLAVSALGIIPASSEENELGVSLASLDNAITVGSNGNDRPDDGRNMALIKEGEFESPEMIAVIERNREDRERTVVIDR
jgi:hypothetical protein